MDCKNQIGMKWLVILLIFSCVGDAQGQDQQPAAPAPVKHRYWTTEWSFEEIDVARLMQRLDRFGISLPVELEGEVSVGLVVSIPLDALRDGRAYRIAGTVRSNRFRIEHLVLSDFRAGLNYADGVLAVDELSTGWNDDGRLTGTASLQISPQGDMVARLQAEDLGLAPLHDLLLQGGALDDRDAGGSGETGGLPALLRGVLSGEIAARVPLDKLGRCHGGK